MYSLEIELEEIVEMVDYSNVCAALCQPCAINKEDWIVKGKKMPTKEDFFDRAAFYFQ